MKVGEQIKIQCYKHDGRPHRQWEMATVLEINDDYIVLANDKTLVTESNGNIWRTKEPAILFFYKNKWYNIIAQMKKKGIFYYCNIATPYIIEDDTLKYIDYDLDLRVFPSGYYKILDETEYLLHKNKMKYSKKLDKSVRIGLSEIIKKFNEKPEYIGEKAVKMHYSAYKSFEN